MESNLFLQELITISLLWEKADYRVKNRVYKPRVKPNGDEFKIYLNKAVDKWVDQAREEMIMDPSVQDKKMFYPESGSMARVAEYYLIYGHISRAVIEAISQLPMFKYLQGKLDIGQRIYLIRLTRWLWEQVSRGCQVNG